MGQLCSCAAPRGRKHKKRERRRSDDASTLGADGSSFGDDLDDDGGDGLQIVIDGDHGHELGGGGERDALLRASHSSGGGGAAAVAAAVMTKRTSKSALLRQTTATTTITIASGGEAGLDPRSAGEQRRNLDVLRSYQKATGVVVEDPVQVELECVMCLDTFGDENPKVRTLCDCGVNRTNFHLSCLLEWLNRDANCPVCRQYLFYEEP